VKSDVSVLLKLKEPSLRILGCKGRHILRSPRNSLRGLEILFRHFCLHKYLNFFKHSRKITCLFSCVRSKEHCREIFWRSDLWGKLLLFVFQPQKDEEHNKVAVVLCTFVVLGIYGWQGWFLDNATCMELVVVLLISWK
jgi:hypothetical protein